MSTSPLCVQLDHVGRLPRLDTLVSGSATMSSVACTPGQSQNPAAGSDGQQFSVAVAIAAASEQPDSPCAALPLPPLLSSVSLSNDMNVSVLK